MAIPTVTALSVGDKFTAARHAELRTYLSFWASPPECIATLTTTVSHTNNTWTLIPLATEDVDNGASYDGAMHSTVTNNSRVVATTAGRYLIEGVLAFAANATGNRLLDVRKNAAGSAAGGTSLYQRAETNMSASYGADVTISIYRTLAAGDYVEMFGLQTSGGALNATSGYLHLRLVGA